MKSPINALITCLATAFTLFAAAPARAVDYVGAAFETASPSNGVTSFGSGPAQSFDINFGVLTRATLAFITFRDEASSVMSFNALVNNFAGYNMEGLLVRLTGGAVFTSPAGTVTPTFGSIGSVASSTTQVTAHLSTGEPYAIHFGNPLSQGGQNDWLVDFSAVQAGSTFGISVSAVPEPGEYAMLLAGLALIGTMARRRRT